MPHLLASLAVCFSLGTATVAFSSNACAAIPPATANSAATSGAKRPPVAPHIEPAAMALMEKVQTTMAELTSYEADCMTTDTHMGARPAEPSTITHTKATIALQKPNLMRYSSSQMVADARGNWSPMEKQPVITAVCDGKTSWNQYANLYSKAPIEDLAQIWTGPEPWQSFFALQSLIYLPARYRDRGTLLEARLAGSASVEGTLCQKVFIHRRELAGGKYEEDDRITWYIGADGLVRRRTDQMTGPGMNGNADDAVVRNIRTNQPVANAETIFQYAPPAGVITSEELAAAREAKLPKRLAAGVSAPDFVAAGVDGKPIKLSDYRGKIVVVDFWASWCGPCNNSMPHTQDVAKRLKAEGLPVVVLAVDNDEKSAAFTKWVKAHPEFSALDFVFIDQKANDVAAKLYHVSGIPTQYIVDAEGKIQSSLVGYGAPNGKLEKAIREAMGPLAVGEPAAGVAAPASL